MMLNELGLRRRWSVVAAMLALVLLVIPTKAQVFPSNTGKPAIPDGLWGQHVLTAATQGLSAPTDALAILYAPSEEDDPAFRAAIAAITGGTVDYFAAYAATPDLTTLSNYDCVMTWTNYPYENPSLFGDNLADHVDAGGSVVLGALSAYTSLYSLSGRIMTSAYSPVVGGTFEAAPDSYAGDGVTAIHAGVTSYSATYREFLTLQGAGIQDGSYTDGKIAQAYRPDFRVIYSNGAGGTIAEGSAPDWPLVIANACGAAHEVQQLVVEIDIEPGRDDNKVNNDGKGKAKVAILGSSTFDVATVDVSTWTFGPAAASPSSKGKGPHFKDVNQDGFMDLLAEFIEKDAGLMVGDTQACVAGLTTGGTPFTGCDTVTVK